MTKDKKRWQLIPLLAILLILFLLGMSFIALNGIGIIMPSQNDTGRGSGGSSWSNVETGIFDGIGDLIEDIGMMLTIIPDGEFGYNIECLENNELEFGACCDRCDHVAEECDMLCTPAMMLMVGDIPPEDDGPEQLECYNDCMTGTGCEFIYDLEDINTMCGLVCADNLFYGFELESECVLACTSFYIESALESTSTMAIRCDYEWDVSDLECRYETTTETFEWDGTPVTNINSFYEIGYPVFYEQSKGQCLNWFRAGTWIDTSEKVGCLDFRFFADSGCHTESVESAANVCEQIGGTFICEENDISCNI